LLMTLLPVAFLVWFDDHKHAGLAIINHGHGRAWKPMSDFVTITTFVGGWALAVMLASPLRLPHVLLRTLADFFRLPLFMGYPYFLLCVIMGAAYARSIGVVSKAVCLAHECPFHPYAYEAFLWINVLGMAAAMWAPVGVWGWMCRVLRLLNST